MAPTGSAEGAKATESRKRTAAGTPAAAAVQSTIRTTGDGDDTSTASTTISKEGVAGPSGSMQAGGSDSEAPSKGEVFYDDEEVEAASNLATFILAASHVAPAKSKKSQPSSAPAALGVAQAVQAAVGGGGGSIPRTPASARSREGAKRTGHRRSSPGNAKSATWTSWRIESSILKGRGGPCRCDSRP